MKYLIEADVIPCLKNLVLALVPFAQAQQVRLCFSSESECLLLRYYPEEISTALLTLVCRIITFTPQGERVQVHVGKIETGSDSLRLNIQTSNTGTDLTRIGEIIQNCRFPIVCSQNADGGTTYELRWEVEQSTVDLHSHQYSHLHIPPQIRGFYAAVRKRLQSHFTQLENKIRAIADKSPQDGVFLQKVNAIILANLEQEDFDTNRLCKSLAMSRTQLFRRFKNLLQESPAHYIRCFRLQKARELLETTDLTVGEVAFKTGFQSQSHFTRVFIERYGARPSAFRRSGQTGKTLKQMG